MKCWLAGQDKAGLRGSAPGVHEGTLTPLRVTKPNQPNQSLFYRPKARGRGRMLPTQAHRNKDTLTEQRM